jgi:hypothetical protein
MSETAKETLQRVRNRRAAFAKKKAEVLRPEVLKAIKELNKSQPDNVKSQKIDAGSDYDYDGIVKAYMKKNDCSYLAATRAVERLVPNIQEIKEKWIEEKNRERQATSAPRSVPATVDGKDFPSMVTDLKINHGMTTWEAHRFIDRERPDLRPAWVDKKNLEGK